MDHSEFVQAWREGKLKIDVNSSRALSVVSSKMFPKRYQAAHLFWSWIFFLSIPAAFTVMYFYTWWAGMLSLVFITPVLFSSTRKSAMEFMIDHSVENPEFYQLAVSEGIIRVSQKP